MTIFGFPAEKENVLTPKVITAEDIQRQKEEKMKNTLMQSTHKVTGQETKHEMENVRDVKSIFLLPVLFHERSLADCAGLEGA